MGIEELLTLGIVGAFTSLVIEIITRYLGTNTIGSKAVTILAAVIIGSLYVWASRSEWSVSVWTILGTASTIYAFFIKKSK